MTEQTPRQATVEQTVIMLETGSGVVQLMVAESVGEVEWRFQTGDDVMVKFTAPEHAGSTPVFINRHCTVVAIFVQHLQVVNDPRMLGMDRTPGGVHLPPREPRVN